jgi:general secretion pathway protein J
MRSPHHPAPSSHRGFTLVEVLVSLFILSIMALMSWRGLDAMTRATEATQAQSAALARLQTGLSQWQADLRAARATPYTPALDFDGRTLRITRTDMQPESGAVRVVAWSLITQGAGATWARWQSGPLRGRTELDVAWRQASQWAASNGSPGDARDGQSGHVSVVSASTWQLYYHRNPAWVNPQSSAQEDAASTNKNEVPDGVRLVLDLTTPAPLGGRITLDWLRPNFSTNRS